MSSPAFTRATVYTRILIFALLILFVTNAMAQWRVDFSRRAKSVKTADAESDVKVSTPKVEEIDVSGKDPSSDVPRRLPPKSTVSHDMQEEVQLDDSLARAVKPLKESSIPMGGSAQDLVVLNTERGFVPSSLRLRMGSQYRLFVVNINEKEKNVSFVMDAFAEHHATFFGKAKVIDIVPQKDGVFEFQCPETAMSGRLVVLPNNLPAAAAEGEGSARQPANRDEW